MTHLPNTELLVRFDIFTKTPSEPQKKMGGKPEKSPKFPKKKSSVFTPAVPCLVHSNFHVGEYLHGSLCATHGMPWMTDSKVGEKISLNKQGGWNEITNIFPKYPQMVVKNGDLPW